MGGQSLFSILNTLHMLGESMMLQLVWKALKQQVLNEAGADAMQNKKPTLHGLIYTTAKQKKKLATERLP